MKKDIELNILFMGGIIILAYWLLTRKKKGDAVAMVEPPLPQKEEPKTIVLNLGNRQVDKQKMRYDFTEPFAKDFNASKFATVAPPKVKIVTN